VSENPKEHIAKLSQELNLLLDQEQRAHPEEIPLLFESEAYNPFIQKLKRYRNIRKNFQDPHPSEYSELESALSLVLDSAVRAQEVIEQELKRVPLRRIDAKRSVYYRLAEAKEYIDAHFLTNINIEEIASVACLSQYHFLRLFKSVFETTPYQYVISKRLQKAAELLEESTHSVGDISMMVCFDTVAAFCDSFKREYGVNPTRFRQGRIAASTN
jgi:AraC-like DNA-binding protein